MKKTIITILIMFFTLVTPAYSVQSDSEVRDLFTIGRGLGSTYYDLLYIADNVNKQPYKNLKRYYLDAFSFISLSETAYRDLFENDDLSDQIYSIRSKLFAALNNQQLDRQELVNTIKEFNSLVANCQNTTADRYTNESKWLLNLGFYSAFQYKSMYAIEKNKYSLKFSDEMKNMKPINLGKFHQGLADKVISTDIKNIKTAEQTETYLKYLVLTTRAYTNYPEVKALFFKPSQLSGDWQGYLVNANKEKMPVSLTIKSDMTGSLQIGNIAREILVSNIELINNYFTFTFNPLGTEKFYVRFNGKFNGNIFSGNVTDSTSDKSFWMLKRVSKANKTAQQVQTLQLYSSNRK